MATDVPGYTADFAPTTWVPDAAPGIAAAQLQRLEDQIEDLDNQVAALSTQFNIHNGGPSITDHPLVTTGVSGLMASADKVKLNGFNYEGEAPANVGATFSGGVDTDLSRGDHRHRILDARVVAVTGATVHQGSAVAPSSTWEVRLGANVARPTSWGSCLVQVTAHVLYANCASGDQFKMRVRIDSNIGPVSQSGVSAAGEEQHIDAFDTKVTSDSTIDIDLELERDSSTHSGVGKYILFNYLLIRAS